MWKRTLALLLAASVIVDASPAKPKAPAPAPAPSPKAATKAVTTKAATEATTISAAPTATTVTTSQAPSKSPAGSESESESESPASSETSVISISVTPSSAPASPKPSSASSGSSKSAKSTSHASSSSKNATESTSASSTQSWMCAPSSCGRSCAGKSKRAVGPAPTSVYQTVSALAEATNLPRLDKRILTTPAAGQVDTFIAGLFNDDHVLGAGAGGEPLNNEEVPTIVNGVMDSNADPTSRFDAFADQPLQAGVEGLYGCMSIVVVSNKGVWTSHFWQNSFAAAFSNQANADAYNKIFNEYVIDPLSNGYPKKPGKFVSLKAVPAGTFDKEQNPQLLVFSPSTGVDNGPPKFSTQVNKVVAAVQKILPDIKGGKLRTYAPMSSSDYHNGVNKDNARGRILTNYDPAANAAGAHGYQTYGQTDLIFDELWGNGCGEGSSQKRDASCSMGNSTTDSGSSSAKASGTAKLSSSSGKTSATAASSSGKASATPESSSAQTLSRTTKSAVTSTAPKSSKAAKPSSKTKL